MLKFLFFMSWLSFWPATASPPFSEMSEQDIREKIRADKKHLSETQKASRNADLEYINCSNNLRAILSTGESFFGRATADLRQRRLLRLPSQAPLEVTANYEQTLKNCEDKKKQYQQAREDYRKAQLNYLNTLSLLDRSKLRYAKVKILTQQTDHIELLFRRTQNLPVPSSVHFWNQEYAIELRHLKRLDLEAYNRFINRIEERGWPVH